MNVSYEYEKRAFSKAWEGRGPRTMTAAHHLTAVLAIGVARLSSSNRIAADPPNATSIVAIERRAPNVHSSRAECANCVEKPFLIGAPGADSLLPSVRDSVDDGQTADDARGAVYGFSLERLVADTWSAARDFERAHGLATTPEIGSALVSQLTGAARMGRQRKGL